jgi:hypothetical protein
MSTRGRRTAPTSGAVRIRRALAVAGCGVVSVSVSACESTEQESAKIAREGQHILAAEAAHARKLAHAHRHHLSSRAKGAGTHSAQGRSGR